MHIATYTESGKPLSDSLLIIIDMQKDFVTGPLGSREAQQLVPKLIDKIKKTEKQLWFTLDTHTQDYLHTPEGLKLPVPHCIKGTEGHDIIDELLPYFQSARVFEKPTFGSVEMAKQIAAMPEIKKVELAGVCTDICVISNALLIKAFRPDIEISVDAENCAGSTVENHTAALISMACCQIEIM
ncbi:nicotinamidase-like amidase [Sphaerochaeta pleomorpha str. Grapes]|uniref:Nicotinamidase-like amidase n=1 Tax=Sphaerochaeta pleomorpha (strain ATCC BAA-1885 / DSM 22778 / Grapes) TaxID=158190 RepID=G8QT34_SPHPG|nr:isochorismatase family cysteine hydrolase [Sphaerochaeta pleomorpha]AEV27939.1 nicotinamidase-like amidase [Sphaerochaeta pleomorpha str. Grapes]